jgi:TonB family protein
VTTRPRDITLPAAHNGWGVDVRIFVTVIALTLAAGSSFAAPRTAARGQKSSAPTAGRNATAAEANLAKKITGDPADPAAYIELARLQEDRGALADALATLEKARLALPTNKDVTYALASFYYRRNQFDRAMSILHAAAKLDPADPRGHEAIATYYWEKATKDKTLDAAQRETYIREGLSATDLALAIAPDFTDALVYKSLLLRARAENTTDASAKARTLAEADALRTRAIALVKAKQAELDPTSPTSRTPPPVPSPPPSTERSDGAGAAPRRVGGNIKPPMRRYGVAPVYPADAQAARIQGIVIVEATIDVSGAVSEVRVLRSVPMLDQAALDAVRQWKYDPTVVDGQAVPVIMTVTVNFSLK